MAAGSLAGEVKGILEARGWALRRDGPRLRVSRAAGGDLCDLVFEQGPTPTRSMQPAVRLRLVPAGGARLTRADRAGLEALRRALALTLEVRRGQDGRALAAGSETQESSVQHLQTGRGARERILRTTLACNQDCRFCFVPRDGRHVPLDVVERELSELARLCGRGAALTLSGGEPTADPRLPEILEAARRRGFERFVVQTNAVFLAKPGLAERLIELGARSYLVSLHSHRPEVYDEITGSRGQLPLALQGLKRLLAAGPAGVTVIVNVVVNARNREELPELAAFLAALYASAPRARRRPGVFFSMLNESGHERSPSWAVDLEAARAPLREAVRRCRRGGLRVERFVGESSFPVCLIERPERHAAPRPLPQERVRYAEDFSGAAGAVGRAKRPACRSCAYDARCAGVPASYARLFGLAALRPLKG